MLCLRFSGRELQFFMQRIDGRQAVAKPLRCGQHPVHRWQEPKGGGSKESQSGHDAGQLTMLGKHCQHESCETNHGKEFEPQTREVLHCGLELTHARALCIVYAVLRQKLRFAAKQLHVLGTAQPLLQMLEAQAAYVRAVEGLMQRYEWIGDKVHRRKMAREAARSVLPNATEVKIVVSGNARAWRTMLELRCGEGAELEIRRMAVAVLRIVQKEAGALFSDFEIYVADDKQEAARVVHHKV